MRNDWLDWGCLDCSLAWVWVAKEKGGLSSLLGSNQGGKEVRLPMLTYFLLLVFIVILHSLSLICHPVCVVVYDNSLKLFSIHATKRLSRPKEEFKYRSSKHPKGSLKLHLGMTWLSRIKANIRHFQKQLKQKHFNQLQSRFGQVHFPLWSQASKTIWHFISSLKKLRCIVVPSLPRKLKLVNFP